MTVQNYNFQPKMLCSYKYIFRKRKKKRTHFNLLHKVYNPSSVQFISVTVMGAQNFQLSAKLSQNRGFSGPNFVP